jgi:phosphoenolpyruvate---glycerone phosphotransferase subunit DhaM
VSVGLVIVSHSAKISEGTAELAGQMAPGVPIEPAGGDADGGIGTDATLIASAIEAAEQGDGVLVLVDLGSAVLATRLAIDELLDPERRSGVLIAEAPLVEGAVIGAVEASTGAALDQVATAAAGAAKLRKAKE